MASFSVWTYGKNGRQYYAGNILTVSSPEETTWTSLDEDIPGPQSSPQVHTD